MFEGVPFLQDFLSCFALHILSTWTLSDFYRFTLEGRANLSKPRSERLLTSRQQWSISRLCLLHCHKPEKSWSHGKQLAIFGRNHYHCYYTISMLTVIIPITWIMSTGVDQMKSFCDWSRYDVGPVHVLLVATVFCDASQGSFFSMCFLFLEGKKNHRQKQSPDSFCYKQCLG